MEAAASSEILVPTSTPEPGRQQADLMIFMVRLCSPVEWWDGSFE